MAFSELIKNFNHLRDYMRDFFIYGYKTRSDFSEKSTRTYDNERRRIESWLGDYVRWEYGKSRPPGNGRKPDAIAKPETGGKPGRGGKRVFMSVDAGRIPQNPLYRAYQSKSFTDNDILLHFFLLDLLEDSPELTAGQAADAISLSYGEIFDVQTVRGKLREYEAAGLVTSTRQGRSLAYRKSGIFFSTLFPEREDARDFLAFFGECAPFSVVGSYLSGRESLSNTRLSFKHHFLVHTLEDTVLLPLTEAIRERRNVEITSFHQNTEKMRTNSANTTAAPHKIVSSGLPVCILVSTQTGRRYLVLHGGKRHCFHSFRLDFIKEVKLLRACSDAEEIHRKGEELLSHTWGASVSSREETEHFSMTLAVDGEREAYILERLAREGRGGVVEFLEPGRYRYSIDVTDTGELMNWVKTFTGRILCLEGDNQAAISRFGHDVARMAAMYPDPEETPGTASVPKELSGLSFTTR